MKFPFLHKKTESAPADNKPPSAPDLTLRFRDAAYGSFCRTRAYEQAGTAGPQIQEWLESHRIAPEQWVLKRRLRRPAPDTETGFAVEQSPYQNDAVPFYKAVEILADYERTQDNLGRVPVAAPDTKTLGDTYLRAFAEREGILFTLDGKPVPTTIDGCVLSDDAFPEGVLESALKTAQDRKTALTLPPPPPRPQIRLLNRDIVFSAQSSAWQEALDILYHLRDFTAAGCRNEWYKAAPEDRWFSESSKRVARVSILLRTDKLPDLKKKFSKAVTTALDDDQARAAMMQNYALLQLYMGLCAVRCVYENIGKNVSCGYDEWIFKSDHDDYDVCYSFLAEAMKEAGFTPEETTSRSFVEHLIRQRKSTEFPPEIKDVIGWFEALFKNVLEARADLPPPPNLKL